MAWTIEKVQRPALVIAHNKTLAAQLCNEFREFFPDNAVEYFVSYYDYYQPEAYVPQADLYIEKDSSQNDDIARLRLVGDLVAPHAPRRRRRRLGLVHLRPRLARGVARARADPRGGGDARPRRGAAQADREPVRAQRHGARPRPLPGQGRRRRGAAGERRDGLPRLVLRRRGRADHALRPADRRGLLAARQPRHLAGDRVRDVDADASSARSTTSARELEQQVREVRAGGPRCSRRTASGSAPSTTWR